MEELDWFEQAVKEMEGMGCVNIVEEFNDTSGEAFVTIADMLRVTEIYDSGCTNHISPYHMKFENFVTITPQMFCVANKQTFSTIGKGDLVINVPSDGDYSQLRLTGVLYSSNVEYTLVSIGRLNEEGFTALFGHGRCLLRGPDEEKIGEVLRTSEKVYKVEINSIAAWDMLRSKSFENLLNTAWLLVSASSILPLANHSFANHVFMPRQYESLYQNCAREAELLSLVGKPILTYGESRWLCLLVAKII